MEHNIHISLHLIISYLLIGGLGVGPTVEVVDVKVFDSLSITEYLLTIHA